MPPNFSGTLSARLLSRLDRIISWTTLILGGLTLAGMTVLSVVNVLVMRKALNAPIRGAEDLMILGLVIVVALAIPFGARTGAHIEIELLDGLMPKWLERLSLCLVKIIGAALMLTLSWRLWISGGQAARFGESSQTLIISFGPFYRILALATALYAVVLLLELVQIARGSTLRRISLGGDDS